MLPPLGPPDDTEASVRLPISAAGQTLMSFSLCNADPDGGHFKWDFPAFVQMYLAPVIEALSPVIELDVESQVGLLLPGSHFASSLLAMYALQARKAL